MYNTIFFMKDGSISTRVFDTYPSDKMIETSGLNLDDIIDYETHY
jgi:hypothetical protein